MVTTPELAEIELELIIVPIATIPFISEVRVLIAEPKVLEFIKLDVVVATFPFTVEVNVKVLVEVEIVKIFKVEEATKFVRSVFVVTPFIVVIRFAPKVV